MLLTGPSHGFSQNGGARRDPQGPAAQNPGSVRADAQSSVTPNGADAGAEAQAMLARYCTTCHNDRVRTAGLALDPAGMAHAGDQSEVWEKVLRQLSRHAL